MFVVSSSGVVSTFSTCRTELERICQSVQCIVCLVAKCRVAGGQKPVGFCTELELGWITCTNPELHRERDRWGSKAPWSWNCTRPTLRKIGSRPSVRVSHLLWFACVSPCIVLRGASLGRNAVSAVPAAHTCASLHCLVAAAYVHDPAHGRVLGCAAFQSR